MLDDMEVTLNCPACNALIKVKMRDINSEKSVPCPGCHKKIQLKADSSFKQSVNDVNKSIDDLNKTIRDINSRM